MKYKCRYYHMCRVNENSCEHAKLHERKDDCINRRCSVLGMFVTCEEDKGGVR